MSKLTLAVVVVAVLLLGSLAYGQGYYGGTYEEDAYQGWQARGGWYSANDAGDGLGLGLDGTWKDYMVSVDWASTRKAGNDFVIWGLSGTYLWRTPEQPGTYYGAGAGWYNVDPDTGSTDSSIGYHVLFGTQLGNAEEFGEPTWFVQAKYLLGTTLKFSDINGIQVCFGRTF